MKTLLRIDASARISRSNSRELGDLFLAEWQKVHPDGKVIYRDLANEPVPHIHYKTIEGFFAPETLSKSSLKNATRLSDQLIKELILADEIVISTPMYNFSVPSSLKAYLDQVVRIGRTFAMDESGFKGLLAGKRGFVLSTKGAIYSEGPLAAMDFLEPYLKHMLKFIGIEQVDFISVEGTTTDATFMQNSRMRALSKINSFVKNEYLNN